MVFPTLSPKEALVLRLLLEDGEHTGSSLIDNSDGELKKGTVYTVLSRMREKQLVIKTMAETWQATSKGRTTLRALEGAARKVS